MKIDKSRTTNTKSNYFYFKNTNFQADFYSLDPDPHLDGIRMEAHSMQIRNTEIKRKKTLKYHFFRSLWTWGKLFDEFFLGKPTVRTGSLTTTRIYPHSTG